MKKRPQPIPSLPKDASFREPEDDRFRLLIENGFSSVSIVSPDGSIIYTTPAITGILGYSVEEYLTLNSFSLLHPEEQSMAQSLLTAILQRPGSSMATTLRVRHKDGSWKFLRLLGTNLLHVPSITGIVIGFTDVTDHSEQQDALRSSEAKLRQIIEHSTNLFYSHTPDHILTYVSPQAKDFFDCEPEEALKRWTEFTTDHPANETGLNATLRAIETGKPQPPYELELRSVLGRKVWVEVRESPVVEDGKTVAIVGSLSDITDRKTADERLKRSEENYRTLIENASDIVTVLDRKGIITFVSPSMQRLIGHSPDVLLGKNMVAFIHPEDQRTIIKSFALGMSQLGRRTQDIARFRHADGTWRIFDSIGMAYRTPEGELVGIVNSRDITDRREVETRLRRSEERYRSFFEDDLSGAYISTPEGAIVDCNPAFIRMFGFASIEEAKQADAATLYKDPEERNRILQLLTQEKKIEYHSFELKRRDGTTLYAVGNIAGIFDAGGRLVRMKGYLFDETRRRLLEGELVQAQKMESLGRLAGGIAHDFNNLLAIILGQASLLARDSSDAERVSKGAETIQKASHRGADLVKQLLTFARKTDVSLGAVDLNASVQELVAFIRVTFPRTVEIVQELAEDLPRISGDATQLYQVILNLCVNARDAMPEGGTLTLSTSVVSGSNLLRYHPSVRVERYVNINVQDTGTGMDEATVARIYEPFFTTKALGKGTGLGLSVAFGIVESHDGIIEVITAPNQGTRFRLYFPVVDDLVQAEDVTVPAPAPSFGGKETILVVEDEEMLRNVLCLALEEKGYRVTTARDGEEGFHAFSGGRSSIDLVITDLGLPKVSGRQLVRQMLQSNPYVRIIVMSGYLEPGVRSELLNQGVKAILQKPFITDDLLSAVRDVLDIKPPS